MECKDPKPKHFRAECTSDSTHEDNAPRFTLEAMANLPLLPDDVLLCIMKYLGPVELHNLSKITERLRHLASDKSLWKTVDFRPHKLTSSQLLKYVKYFKVSTKFLAVRGFASEAPNCKRRDGVFTPELLEELVKRCPELETLILDEYVGPACKLGIELFPSTICHLSMRNCVITHLDPLNSYFHYMYAHVPHIKVLILSNCKWVSPHDFMAISKCYWLEELRMDGCLQLGDCVAYASLAARCGFYSLKILDLRNTRMGDSDVTCFSHSLRLTHLYLQCPSADNEVSDGLCGVPSHVEGDNFVDSNNEDDIDAPPFIEDSHDAFSPLGDPPLLPENTLPSFSARTLHAGSRVLLESGNRPSPSRCVASCVERDENEGPCLPQASTSRGNTNIVLNPRGPSHTGSKVGSVRKQPLGDSGSSSDDNLLSFAASPTSGPEELPTSQASCRGVSETGNRDRKCRPTPSDRSLTSNEPSTVTHSLTEPPSCSINDMNCKLQDADSLWQKPRSVSDSSGSTEELNYGLESDVPETNNSERGRSSRVGDSLYGPRLFRCPSRESTAESLISDVCTMAFVLKEHGNAGSGYVWIVSPQAISSRPQLHTLVLKNYRKITDKSLICLLRLNSLRYLDVSGTSVTQKGVLDFRLKRPDVEVISDYKDLPI